MALQHTAVLLTAIALSFALPFFAAHDQRHLSTFPTIKAVIIQQPPNESPSNSAAVHAGFMGALALQKFCNMAFHCINVYMWAGKDGDLIQSEVRTACEGDAPRGTHGADQHIWPPPGIMPTAFMVSLLVSDLVAYAPYVTGRDSHLVCLLSLAFNVAGYYDHLCVYGGSLCERLVSTLPWMPLHTATAIAGYMTSPLVHHRPLSAAVATLSMVSVGALSSRPTWLQVFGVRAATRGRRGYGESAASVQSDKAE